VIAIADTVRPEAARTITRLKQLGIQEIVMTGDNDLTARSIALEIKIDQVYSELLPERRCDSIAATRVSNGCNGGDGINDAPALAQASVDCNGNRRQRRGAGYPEHRVDGRPTRTVSHSNSSRWLLSSGLSRDPCKKIVSLT